MTTVHLSRTTHPVTVTESGFVVQPPARSNLTIQRAEAGGLVVSPPARTQIAVDAPVRQPIVVERTITGVPGRDAVGGESVPYAVEIDDVGSGVTYIGKADPGSAASASVWQIQRVTITGSDMQIEWANGSADFENAWTSRASLTYS